MAYTRPLSSGLAGCCKTARLGGGLPGSEGGADSLAPRPWLPPDVLRLIDALARRLEREERLRAMNGGMQGKTLVDAARAGGLCDVRFLLDRGADINFDDCRPLRAAAVNGHVAVMTALLDADARYADGALWSAGHGGHVSAAALLLARGANIHHGIDCALRCAAQYGHLEMVAFLLDNGADLHSFNDEALQHAQRFGHTAVAALLLERAGV